MKQRVYLSDEQVKDVYSEYVADGVRSLRSICKDRGVNYATIWRRCTQMGLPIEYRTRRPPRRTRPPAEDLAKRYESGASVTVMAREHGVTYLTMRKWLVGIGVEIRTQAEQSALQRIPTPPAEQLAREYEAGDSMPAIGRRHGMAVHLVMARLEQAGVARRNPKQAAQIRGRAAPN